MTVQCPTCLTRPEWKTEHDRDNRGNFLRCGQCRSTLSPGLFKHLNKLESDPVGFTEDEKLANTSLLQMDTAFRQLRPIDADSQEILNRAITALRMTLGKRVTQRDLPREIRQ